MRENRFSALHIYLILKYTYQIVASNGYLEALPALAKKVWRPT